MRNLIVIAFLLVAFPPNVAGHGNSGNALPVTVENTPSVNIDNSDIPVTIQNDEESAVPVIPLVSERVPFQIDVDSGGFETGSAFMTFDTPAEGILVIESLTLRITSGASPDGLRFATIRTSVNGVSADHHIVSDETRVTGFGTQFFANSTMRFYADPDSEVQLLTIVDPVGSASNFTSWTISGYVVPASEPSLSP